MCFCVCVSLFERLSLLDESPEAGMVEWCCDVGMCSLSHSMAKMAAVSCQREIDLGALSLASKLLKWELKSQVASSVGPYTTGEGRP